MPESKKDIAEHMKDTWALQKITKDDKKKERKQDPFPRRGRSNLSHNGARENKEKRNLAQITKAIIREGGSVPDVAAILACKELEDGGKWIDGLIDELRQKKITKAKFWEIVSNRASVDLIKQAWKVGFGYDYTEEVEDLEPKLDCVNGNPIPWKFKLLGKKAHKKKQSGDAGMLKFLLQTRMPDYFRDTKHLEINSRTVGKIKLEAKEEIKGFLQGLVDSFEEKEGEFIENRESLSE